jgi:cytochrome c oxidase subunit 4
MAEQRAHGQVEPGHGDPGYHDEHGGLRKYVLVFVALCVLTTLSFLTYFDFWRETFSVPVSRALMMAVSCGKALLVMLFFMHLLWEANWKYVLTFPAMMMSIFLMCMLVPDVGMRTRHYTENRWLHAAAPISGSAEHGHEGESPHEDGKKTPEKHGAEH